MDRVLILGCGDIGRRRMREEPGIALLRPTLAPGLAASLDEDV